MAGDHLYRAAITRPMGRRRLLSAAALLAMEAGSPVAGPVEQVAAEQGRVSGTPGSMLRLVPAPYRWLDRIASYTNFAGQLAAVGLSLPSESDDEAWSRFDDAVSHLNRPAGLVSRNLVDWRKAFGFDLSRVDQSLYTGSGTAPAMVLRGRFNSEEARAALAGTGYRTVANEAAGATIVSISSEDKTRPESPLRYDVAGQMDNAAILEGGLIAFSASVEGIQAVQIVIAGEVPSLVTEPGIAPLIHAMGTDVASAVVVRGESLRWERTVDWWVQKEPRLAPIAPQRTTEPPMPPVWLALFGVTPGGPVLRPGLEAVPKAVPLDPTQPEPRARIVLLLGSADEALTAVEVIEHRLDTWHSFFDERPFADIFPPAERQAQAIPGERVVRIDLGFGPGMRSTLWVDKLGTRDVGFVAW